MSKPPPRICFVSHASFGAMTGHLGGHIGGVERQTRLLAEHFRDIGYQVSVVTWKEPGVDIVEVDKIQILSVCERNAGLPGFRFFYPRWSSLITALKQANADVYYHNCAEVITGQIAMWCAHNDRAFVYSVASDAEVEHGLPRLADFRERLLYTYGLRRADSIITQTAWQRRQLVDNFGLESTVLPMPADPRVARSTARIDGRSGSRLNVCWIGRIAPVKRPDMFLEIAERLPEADFELVGPGDAEERYVARILQTAQSLPNVSVKGPVGPYQIAEILSKSDMLLCTSAYEGFPNTFVEAWANCRPVISTVDPDGLLEKMQIGRVFSCLEHGVEILQTLSRSRTEIAEMGERAQLYFLDKHSPDKALPRFSGHVQNVLRRRRTSSGE